MQFATRGDSDEREAEVIESREPARGVYAEDAEDVRAAQDAGDEVAADAREPGLGEHLADVVREDQHERCAGENLHDVRAQRARGVVVPVRRRVDGRNIGGGGRRA